MKNVHEIEYTVESKEWTKALDKAFSLKKKDLKIDGFRKGSVPKDIYIKKVGIETLYMDAVDLVLDDAYHKVLEDNNLVPECEPKVDIKEINDKSVTFIFTIIVKPEVKLGKYKKLGVKKGKAEVKEEEIDAEIKRLQDRFADVVELTEGKVENTDTAIIDFEGKVDGEVLEGGTGADYPLEIGSNSFIPGFEEGLIGMAISEERILNLKFPEEYVEDLKGKDVEFKVTLKGIKKRILPELNEEFFKDLGYDNVKTEEELRQEVKEHLLSHKEEDVENEYADNLIEKALEGLEVEINSEITEAQVNRMINRYREQLKMQGLSLEQYLDFTKSTIEQLKDNMTESANKQIKVRYLLEEIALRENIEVTHEEIHEEAEKQSEYYQITSTEYIEAVGGEDVIAYDLKTRKAIEVLKNN